MPADPFDAPPPPQRSAPDQDILTGARETEQALSVLRDATRAATAAISATLAAHAQGLHTNPVFEEMDRVLSEAQPSGERGQMWNDLHALAYQTGIEIRPNAFDSRTRWIVTDNADGTRTAIPFHGAEPSMPASTPTPTPTPVPTTEPLPFPHLSGAAAIPRVCDEFGSAHVDWVRLLMPHYWTSQGRAVAYDSQGRVRIAGRVALPDGENSLVYDAFYLRLQALAQVPMPALPSSDDWTRHWVWNPQRSNQTNVTAFLSAQRTVCMEANNMSITRQHGGLTPPALCYGFVYSRHPHFRFGWRATVKGAPDSIAPDHPTFILGEQARRVREFLSAGGVFFPFGMRGPPMVRIASGEYVVFGLASMEAADYCYERMMWFFHNFNGAGLPPFSAASPLVAEIQPPRAWRLSDDTRILSGSPAVSGV